MAAQPLAPGDTCLFREARRHIAKVAPLWGGDPRAVRQGPFGTGDWPGVVAGAYSVCYKGDRELYGGWARSAAACATYSVEAKPLGALAALSGLAHARASSGEPPMAPIPRKGNSEVLLPRRWCRRRKRVGATLLASLKRGCGPELDAAMADDSNVRAAAQSLVEVPLLCPYRPPQAQFDGR